MRNSLSLNLSVSILRQGKSFVAYSPALDISTCGKTETEAKKRFHELVQIFFEELAEAGTTEKVLGDLGWTKKKQEWKSPEKVVAEMVRVAV